MKITVCRDCGLTMSSGVISCRRCKKKNLSPHDILCEDTYRLHKRVTELSTHNKGPKYLSQGMASMLVIAVTGLGMAAYDYCQHPEGAVAQQVKPILSMIPGAAPTTIAKAKNGSQL